MMKNILFVFMLFSGLNSPAQLMLNEEHVASCDSVHFNEGMKLRAMPGVVASNIPFPNPVKNLLNIKVEENSVLALLNMNGQEVFSMQGEGKVSIYTTDFPDGFYVLSISNGRTFIRHKVLVHH